MHVHDAGMQFEKSTGAKANAARIHINDYRNPNQKSV